MPNLIQALYKGALQPILFAFDAEFAHNRAVHALRRLEALPTALKLIRSQMEVTDPRLTVHMRNLTFANPVGLAAGFDKAAELPHVLSNFGFGFLELGTFTPLPQEGQKRPRLFRYKKEKALINRMGFNNPGVKVAMEGLRRLRERWSMAPLALNIGKGRETPLDEAFDDYLTAFELAHPHADMMVLNVSSPNTPHLRDLQGADHLKTVLAAITRKNRAMAEAAGRPSKLIFTKVSPDANEETLEDIARIAIEFGVGLVATNTTLDHAGLRRGSRDQTGGLSGKPLREKSNAVLKRLRQLTKGVVPLIGVGGIFTAADAYEKIRLGASLVQTYTGWIYEGPTLVPSINRGLLTLLEKDGFKSIQEAVGTL